MGQNSRDKAESTDRLDEATDETHCTLAHRIMVCGDSAACVCLDRKDITPGMLDSINGLIVDCVADCIDILRGEKNDARINNR